MNIKVIVVAAIAATILATAQAELPKPEGWMLFSPTMDKYVVWSDSATTVSGVASVGLKSKSNDAKEYASAMQMMPPGKYLNKRVRFSGFLKTENVTGSAGLWLRVDGANREALGFDNMQTRPVKGTTDWRRYDVVLDVPTGATNLAFGALLVGAGNVWMDKVSMEAVSLDVPVTNLASKPPSLPTPAGIELR